MHKLYQLEGQELPGLKLFYQLSARDFIAFKRTRDLARAASLHGEISLSVSCRIQVELTPRL